MLFRNVYEIDRTLPVDRRYAEELCGDALRICGDEWEAYEGKLDLFIETTVEFLKLQARLEKTGRYLYSTFGEVEEAVFKNKVEGKEEGVEYLWGLYFSRVFWVPHYRLSQFFLKEFATVPNGTGLCLEAPGGSGVFLSQFLEHNPQFRGVSVDLSETALAFARRYFDLRTQHDRVALCLQDINALDTTQVYDRIICTEFLEHVEDPKAILCILKQVLAPGGKLFLTTVAWTAFIDHIYLYQSIEEIQEQVRECGYSVEQEYVQSVFPKDAHRLMEHKVALNYAAVLTHRPE